VKGKDSPSWHWRSLTLQCLIFAGMGCLIATANIAAEENPTLKLAPMPGIGHLVPQLALALGYFEAEGLKVEFRSVMEFHEEDWMSTELLNEGKIDAEICWFHRIPYGNGHDQPARAVMVLENAPGMTIFVAEQQKDTIRSAADFAGKHMASGMGFSTKYFLTNFLAMRNGVADNGFVSVPYETYASLPDLFEQLREGNVDVVTLMEPSSSKLQATGLASPLYELIGAENTRKALGNVWLSRSLYLSPDYIEAHPETVQKLVNVMVRTMRWLNTHDADEIAEKLPIAYFGLPTSNHDWRANKATQVEYLREVLPNFARDDYSIPPAAAELLIDVVMASEFDDTDEGIYRRTAAEHPGKLKPEDTYDNSFVEKAMLKYP